MPYVILTKKKRKMVRMGLCCIKSMLVNGKSELYPTLLKKSRYIENWVE
jgi:hypothetical protein